MKISVNEIKETPPNMEFNFCVFGEPNEKVKEWCVFWNIKIEVSGKFTNLIIPKDVKIGDMFEEAPTFEFLDGFSPNLNKHLHVGHLSNLIIASAFKNLGIANKTIAIMGDTLEGDVVEADALSAYYEMIKLFNYKVDWVYLASEMVYNGPLLLEGTENYEGTKIFDIDGEKIVGVKSDGSTSYFYQDMALAETLNANTLYLTGFEQDNHFKTLKKAIPTVNHIGLGLVMVDGVKMSSRLGNVIMASELIANLSEKFDDSKLIANVIQGQILKSNPDQIKNINTKEIFEPKTSAGLYMSYTLARLKSAGLKIEEIDDFISQELQFSCIKAKVKLSPNILFKSLVDLCKKINNLYASYKIMENQSLYQPLINDLMFGMCKLGMHEVDKV